MMSMPVVGQVGALCPRHHLVGASSRWSVVVAIALLALAGALLLSTLSAPASAPSRPATQVRTLACESLPDVPGKSMTTALVVFPPLAYTPAHRHPGSVTAYVISGSITSQMDGTPPKTYAAGSTWFEPAGALHRFAENSSPSDSAELLAVFVTDHECGPLVIPEPRDQGPA
jgi:quercetin dioxygenase-like cupin family protein